MDRRRSHDSPSSSIAASRDEKKSAVATIQDEEQQGLLPERAAGAPVDWVATGLCFVFPAVGGLLFGYDIGATSGVLQSLSSPTLSGTDWYDLSSFQSGLVVSMSLAGALVGSLITLAAGNKLGRKTELLTAAVLYGVSAALMGGSTGLTQLLCGRFAYGLGIGFAMHAAPAYIAETAPPSARGLLVSLKEVAIVGGILFGYLVSYFFAESVGGWRSIYGAAAPLGLLLGVGMATLPESPRWLALSGAPRADVRQALVRAQGSRASDAEVVDIELDMMENSVVKQDSTAASSPLVLLKQQRYYTPLLIGMSLMLFQQITGQPSVLYYASKIFKDVGFAAGNEASGVAVILGLFKLVMTTVAVLKVDSWGRRPLLLGGVTGMVAALLALGFAQQTTAAGVAADPTTAYVSVAALLVYVGCYQFSFGPISWLIVGEIFPLAVRSQAIALAALVNFGSNFGVSLALPTVQDTIGIQNTYLAFAAIGVAAVAVIYAYVPETKGKSLEEIESMWVGKSSDIE